MTFKETDNDAKHVIIFDGYCNLCNRFVDLIIKYDKRGVFRFTANQLPAGKKILDRFSSENDQSAKSVYYYSSGILYRKSTAALKIARLLPFPFSLLYVFILVPRFIRDGVYDLIAARRYRWFGEREICRIPTEEERNRFLD